MADIPYETEAGLQLAVEQLAGWLGLRCWHDVDSRRNKAGFPDLVIVGPGGILWRELKKSTGRTSKAQDEWGAALRAAGQDWAVWKPGDMRSGRIRSELEAIR